VLPPVVVLRRYILELLKADLKPRDIMTYKAFENAMVTVMATGGRWVGGNSTAV
jgi:dihydroxyacid dehydratase/phosphogluconate dehydratase